MKHSLLLLALATCASSLLAAPWAQFRGPGGSGVDPVGTVPLQFGAQTNLLWKRSLPSGHSSPCLWDQQLFLTGYDQEQLQVLCLDRTTGALLWQRSLTPDKIERGHRNGNPATSTPVCDGSRLYIYFGSFGLVCFDLKGEELWRHPLPTPITQHGAGTSPILSGDLLILNCDQDVGSYLLAVDKLTGKTAWRTERAGFRRGFSTPTLWPPRKPVEVVVAGTLRVVGYDLVTGRERWSVGGLPNEICATPVSGEGLLFVSGWTMGTGVAKLPAYDSLLERGDKDHDDKLSQAEAPEGPAKMHFAYIDADKDGLITRQEWETIASIFNLSENALLALKPEGTGDLSKTAVVWKATRGLPYVPSPLYYQGRIFLVKNGGMLSCYEAATGRAIYQEERLEALGDYYASPVAAGGRVCVVSQSGMVVILSATSDQLEVLARIPLGEAVMATPALADGILYCRTASGLAAFGGQK